jgi:hypothetical protein
MTDPTDTAVLPDDAFAARRKAADAQRHIQRGADDAEDTAFDRTLVLEDELGAMRRRRAARSPG